MFLNPEKIFAKEAKASVTDAGNCTLLFGCRFKYLNFWPFLATIFFTLQQLLEDPGKILYNIPIRYPQGAPPVKAR